MAIEAVAIGPSADIVAMVGGRKYRHETKHCKMITHRHECFVGQAISGVKCSAAVTGGKCSFDRSARDGRRQKSTVVKTGHYHGNFAGPRHYLGSSLDSGILKPTAA